MSSNVVNSKQLASVFDIDVVPLRFANSIDDLGRITPGKLVRAFAIGVQLGCTLLRRPVAGVYFTLSVSGGAYYRDVVYVALMRASGARRVFHLHGKGIQRQLTSRWQRWLGRAVFRGADVIVLAAGLADELEGLVPSARLHVVANGVKDSAADMHDFRPHKSECPRILFLSNMIEDKGPLVLLEALALLKRRNVAFKATFAGGRVENSIAAFESIVARHGLEADVSYLGPVYGDAKDALMRDHDLFAFPTFYALEAFPLVVLEAMQWALPVITTAEGAIPEIVEDGVTGYIVPSRDPSALASRLEQLLLDDDLRRTMGQLGRARFLGKYTREHFERSICDTLARCLGRAPETSGSGEYVDLA